MTGPHDHTAQSTAQPGASPAQAERMAMDARCAPSFPTGGIVERVGLAPIRAGCCAPLRPTIERAPGVVTVTVEIPRERFAAVVRRALRVGL